MKTIEPITQEDADLAEVARLIAEGKRVTDPELRRRVTERGDEARRVMLARNGVTNMAVDLVREGRDEELMEVLDASVGLKWVLNEVNSNVARTLRDEYRAGRRDFVAPDIFAVECAHSLTKAHRRGAVIDPRVLYAEIMLDSPRLFSSAALMDRAVQIASRSRIAVYDCVYVALAEREGCELITTDEKLVRNLRSLFPFIVAL